MVNSFCEDLASCFTRAHQLLTAIWEQAELHKNDSDKTANRLFTWLCVYLRGGFVPPATMAQLLGEKCAELRQISAGEMKRDLTPDEINNWVIQSVSSCEGMLKRAEEFLVNLDLKNPTWPSRLL